MTIKQIALALVFLGAVTSVNAQSITRQTDESLLANNSLSTNINIRQLPNTVSALESRELREHYSDQVSATLTRKLNTKLAFQPADLKIN